MPSESSASKRRASKEVGSEPISKRKASSSSKDAVTLQAEDTEPIGPVLVSLSDFCPDNRTKFHLYRASNDGNDETPHAPQSATLNDRLLLAGDTNVMQYNSSNWGWGASAQTTPELRRETRGYSGNYVLGVYDKKTKQVTLRTVPLFTMNRSVKALSQLSAMATETGTNDGFDYTKARRDLGEAFGNKKQKQAARNMDRMKVNTENMDSILEHVASGIDESAATLPSEKELAAALSASRALPQAHVDAGEPADVYPMDELVPATVLKALHTRHLLKCTSQADLGKSLRSLSLPSPWLLPRMWQLVQTAQNDAGSSSKAMELVRLGYYISILLAFRKQARGLGKSDDGASHVAQKMRLPDHEKDIVIEHLTSQFAEQARSSQRHVLTATGETRLLAHILVLGLHLEEFNIAPQPVAQELAVPVQRVNEMFKSLGCSSSQATQHGVDEEGVTTTQERRWRLRLPLSFPSQRKRGPPRR